MSADDSTTRLWKTGAATALMLIAGWLVTPMLSNWQSRQLAGRLAAQIADSEDADVKVPLRQLASLGEPAIESLIAASASERAAVARIARRIIEEKLATWENLAASSSPDKVGQDFASSTTTLAIALAANVNEFGPTGKQWAERLALTMIELAGSLPAAQSDQVLENCSRVLAAVPPRGPRLRTITSIPEIADPARFAEFSAAEPRLESIPRASEGSLDNLARLQSGPFSEFPDRLTRVPTPRHEAALTVPGRGSADLNWSPRRNEVAAKQLTPVLPTKPPTFTQPIAEQPPEAVASQVVDVPTPQEMSVRADALRQISSTKLLQSLSDADFYEAGVVRSVLGERGFADAEFALRHQLTSPDVGERLRLIEDVSRLPAATARHLLGWLLDDEHGDVRLRALTALATTNAPELNELARELAVRDEDPRVAELASRLLNQSR